jgi:hypothetical protein
MLRRKTLTLDPYASALEYVEGCFHSTATGMGHQIRCRPTGRFDFHTCDHCDHTMRRGQGSVSSRPMSITIFSATPFAKAHTAHETAAVTAEDGTWKARRGAGAWWTRSPLEEWSVVQLITRPVEALALALHRPIQVSMMCGRDCSDDQDAKEPCE